jgi:hypothetical protein
VTAKPPGKLIPPPLGCFKLRDPHHDGAVEWTYWRGVFFSRPVGARQWTPAHRIHLTARRVQVLASLVTLEHRHRR